MEESGPRVSSPVHTRSTPTPNQPAPLSFPAPPVTQWLTAGLGAAMGRPGRSIRGRPELEDVCALRCGDWHSELYTGETEI